MNIEKSPKGEMNSQEGKMATENSFIAIAVFAVPYIAQELMKVDFGELTPIVGAVLTGITFFLKEKYNITTAK